MVTVISMMRSRLLALIILSPLTVACAPVALTVFGVGTAVGVNYTLNGYAYKTFTAPLDQVKSAARKALGRMGIKVGDEVKGEDGYTLTAMAAEWKIEIFLEPISAKATRMRSTVSRNALQKDRATAIEIVIQTESVLLGN